MSREKAGGIEKYPDNVPEQRPAMHFVSCKTESKYRMKRDVLMMPEQKLLVIHQGSLGDFIMTFPVMTGLRKVSSRIDVLSWKNLGELARELNLIEKSYALESAAMVPLYSDSPDCADAKTATLLKSYDRIILFSFSRELQENIERIAGANVLRIPPRPPAGEKIHVSRFLWDRLLETGLFGGIDPYSPSIFQKGSLHQPIGRPDSAPVLIHPGSGSMKKNWPLDNFILLGKMLRKDGLMPEFILGPAECHLSDRLPALPESPPVHIVDDLLQALSLLKRSYGFIGNDSGLSHLAAIIGLPVTVIFGPSDPVRWKPLGPAVAVVRSVLDCKPCHETNERTCDSPHCFKGISPQMVLPAFLGLTQGLRQFDR